MLIKCVVYRSGRKLADIEASEIHDYLGQPDCFVWVALREPDAAMLEEMRKQFGLHPLAVEDARHGHQRPKVEEYGDSLFVVLHMIELCTAVPQVGEVDSEVALVGGVPQVAHSDGPALRVGEVDIFAGRDYVLSVRTGVETGFQDVRARCESEPDHLRQGPGFVLYALMDAVVDRYFPVIDRLESELDDIEERIFMVEDSGRANVQMLYSLKQRLGVLKRAVAPLLEGVSNLSGARVPALVGGFKDYFRDVADHLQRLNQAIESTRDSVTTAISVNLSLITLQQNETMKRLAAYAALVAIPTLIAGIYGMNFEHMPELKWRYGYGLALAVMGGLDAYLFYRFRKARWL